MSVQLNVNPTVTAMLTGVVATVEYKGRKAEIVKSAELSLGIGWRVIDGGRYPSKAVRKVFDHWTKELSRGAS
jgi:hypothetical protein